ncbi:MAG: hypothetical protein VYB59_09750 [Pseudomonadota bacterium]|nr:hypothetical protein [Pseudomonadota bacterium]
MESVSAEELLIEEGKSGEISAAFDALKETTVDEGPKYSQKTCRELARAIVCRNYGKTLLELAYLLIIASACDRRTNRYEELFWSSGVARPSAFKGYIQCCQNLPASIELVENGVTVQTDTESFTVTYSRMPFLSALLEFLMTTIGYADLNEHAESLCGGVPSRAVIGEAANGISRRMYEYLREHLPSAHTQRKTHLLVSYMNNRIGRNSGPDDIDDDALLEFWIDKSSDEDGSDFRTYTSVFQAGVELRKAMAHALNKFRMSGARSIGTDVEAGEVDPGDIEEAAEAIESDMSPLAALAVEPLESIKFLNGRETETATEIAHGPGIAIALSRSVFRNAVFGRAQSRITNALRHKRLTGHLIHEPTEKSYQARLEDYREFAGRLEKLLLAVLHVLAITRRPEAIDLAMTIRPDIDFGSLADDTSQEPEWQDSSVISISAVRAAERFYDYAGARAAGNDPLVALMADARKAFRGNARQGFNDDDLKKNEVVDSFAEAVPHLLSLRREIDAFVRFAASQEWDALFDSDTAVFTQQFQLLYGVQHGA